jgi:hypothetical protein
MGRIAAWMLIGAKVRNSPTRIGEIFSQERSGDLCATNEEWGRRPSPREDDVIRLTTHLYL